VPAAASVLAVFLNELRKRVRSGLEWTEKLIVRAFLVARRSFPVVAESTLTTVDATTTALPVVVNPEIYLVHSDPA
jgi:predicted DNA-binding protein (UPF0278 family)